MPEKNKQADIRGLIAGPETEGGSTDLLLDEREWNETPFSVQIQVLEKVAAGIPLKEILDFSLRLCEARSGEMLCSILLLDPDGTHLRHGAAPSLPAEYMRSIDGSSIGPCAGSCGTAAFKGEPVIVTDINADPPWIDHP